MTATSPSCEQMTARPGRPLRHGPPGGIRRAHEDDGAHEAAGRATDDDGGAADGQDRRSRWPWRSTVLLTVFVLVGSGFAEHAQEGERVALDPLGRVLLFLAGALLLWRKRHPVPVVFGTVAAVLLYAKCADAKHIVDALTKKHGKAKALSIFAHKIGRCVYYMLKNRRAFHMPTFLSA